MKSKPLSPGSLGYGRADKRLEILRLVALHGSISQAARTAGVSYKAAWQALHTLTNLAGEALVDSSVGGPGGGGARVTVAGARLLEAADQLDAARRDVLARFNGPARDALAGPRTSMRNNVSCLVERLEGEEGRDPMMRVILALPEQGRIAALITRESAQLLDLRPELPVLALFKATAVRVVQANAASQLQEGVNHLQGRVTRISRGTHHDEAIADVAGLQLVGFADRPNRLRAGSEVNVLVDESAVVIALRH